MRLFPAPRAGHRAEALEKFQNISTLTGVVARGEAVFEKQCSSCHTRHGHGHAVGPDLGEFAGKSMADFLAATLDPNAAINPNYPAWNLETKDGRHLTGVIRGENASGFTLVQGGGIEEKFLRSDLKEMRPSPLSLMPEGLEQSLTPQDLADLIAWIKAPSKP